MVKNNTFSTPLPFATGNQKKLDELLEMGIQVTLAPYVKPVEIQGTPDEVLQAKAIDAYVKNSETPTLVEDTALEFDYLGGLPGSYAKDFLTDRAMRQRLSEMIPPTERGATFRVGLAVYDGQKVHIWVGMTRGSIALKPQGPATWHFDDIFIPDGETRTYAQMSQEEKNKTSARAKAYALFVKNPPNLSPPIDILTEPSVFQLRRIDKEMIVKNSQALTFAFGLEILQKAKIKPNTTLTIDDMLLPKLETKEYADGAVREYTFNTKSPSQGIVLLPEIDLKSIVTRNGKVKPVRLDVCGNEPVFLKMGKGSLTMALAARCREFMDMHSDTMYAHIRGLIDGSMTHIPRSNTRSEVLENILGISVRKDLDSGHNVMVQSSTQAIATKELGYKRLSYDGVLSRKKASLTGTMILGPDGIVSNIFALGGMPPVTGARDTLVTAALSYMRSWIPHNGVFAGDFERQLALFLSAKDQIKSFKLPPDIEENCIKQIGITIGSEEPAVISEKVSQFYRKGGHAARIYTTNPDHRVIETAKAIRKATGEDFLICVGPVTDARQARELKNQADVRMFLIGHGGGENCTSLAAGGAANSIEILYEMYLDPYFNDALIGLEGGTGETIGALLPFIDVISLNRRGVGGVELTGGYFVRQTKMDTVRAVLPYHGSASVPTQLIESYLFPEIAKKRLTIDGSVRAVEGKPNYMIQHDAIKSCVDQFAHNRALAGLAIADQQSHSLYELRARVAKFGHNHVEVTPDSSAIAGEHRKGI